MAKPTPAAELMPVTAENFVRAESDLYFSAVVKKRDGFGKFEHNRALTPIDQQTIIRMNRDTLYSGAVFDLDAGPVTITLPDPGKRFMSLQVINEDQYTLAVIYAAGEHTFSREQIGTRYVIMEIRLLVDPSDPADLNRVHSLQDAIKGKPKRIPARSKCRIGIKPVRRKCASDALLALCIYSARYNTHVWNQGSGRSRAAFDRSRFGMGRQS